MLPQLKRHPFPVSAHFDYSLILTFALPIPLLEPFLYPRMQLDVFGDHAFVAIALVRTRQLRPSLLPAWLGQSFFLSGYRIFTRFITDEGKRLRGLRILRSDADSWLMVLLGNLMTHYGYRKVRVREERCGDLLRLEVESADSVTDLSLTANLAGQELPADTIFADWRQARRYCGPLPFTFSYEPGSARMVVVQGERTQWEPRGVEVELHKVNFFDQPQFGGCRPPLVNAFFVEDIPYRWKSGKLM